MDKVVLGLSGGVDSAVAAHLLRESGLAVYGLYLDNGLPGADAAREAAASLSVPLTITDSREAMEPIRLHPVCRSVSPRRDAEPLHSLQPGGQVPRSAGRSGAHRGKVHRHRALCQSGKRRHLPRAAGK